MSRMATDPYEKVMKHHGFNEEFRERVLASRRQERAERLRSRERVQAIVIMREQCVPKWVRDLVIEVSAQHDLPPEDVYAKGRVKPAVKARQEVMYLIKKTRPATSSTWIGRWFRRDAKTVLHSIAAHQHRHGLPRLTEYNLRAQRLQAANWYSANRWKRKSHAKSALDQRQSA